MTHITDLYKVVQPIEDALGGGRDIRIEFTLGDSGMGDGDRGVDFVVEEEGIVTGEVYILASDCNMNTFADALRAVAKALETPNLSRIKLKQSEAQA